MVHAVRYTDCSWGATNCITTTFNGSTYEEILVSIDGAIDAVLRSVQDYDVATTVGISIERVKGVNHPNSVFGCYINLHLGPIMGGDDLVSKLNGVVGCNEQKSG